MKFNKINRFSLVIIFIFSAIVFVSLFALIFREEYYETSVASVSDVEVSKITVIDNNIKLTGKLITEDFNYSYYQIRYENDRAYIKLYSTKRKIKNGKNIFVDVNIENGVNKILLERKSDTDVITLWQIDQ